VPVGRGGEFDDLLLLARHLGRPRIHWSGQDLARVYSLYKARMWARDRAAASAKRAGGSGPEGSIGKLLWTVAMRQISDLSSQLLGPLLTADTGEWGHVRLEPARARRAGLSHRRWIGRDPAQHHRRARSRLPGEPRVDRDIPFSELVKLGRGSCFDLALKCLGATRDARPHWNGWRQIVGRDRAVQSWGEGQRVSTVQVLRPGAP
jgi:hypothetical protein